MTEQKVNRRVLRRERYRSRSLAVVIALSLVSLGAAYAGTEAVLAALGLTPLLIAPVDALAAVDEPTQPVIAGAAVAVVLGLVAVIVALAPGRRSRHVIAHDRLAILVDDEVLAGSFGRTARVVAGVPADRVHTTVTPRRVGIAVTPSSGFPVDQPSVAEAARQLATELATTPSVRVGARVSTSGVVGS